MPKMRNIAETAKKAIPDVLAAVGALSISYGAYLIIKPLGYIALGSLLIYGGYLWSKSK